MEKYQNKYRISSHRKRNWDYSSNAIYFLTIVTQYRECNLGKIINNDVVLSDYGKIVEYEWYKSFEIRDELLLHDFIIMPNHLHTILEIYNDFSHYGNKIKNSKINVETHGRASLQMYNRAFLTNNVNQNHPVDSVILQIKRNPAIRLPKSISSFIAGFKSAVNTKIDNFIDLHELPIPKYNRNNHFFQPNYHDHIIRNESEFLRIKNYIKNNPLNWDEDQFNSI
jgi:REP element-mobilizing transposase RayT